MQTYSIPAPAAPAAPAGRLTPEQAALRLGVTARTLAKWRHEGRGPRYVKLARAIFYRASDLDAFEEACVRTPMSSTAA